MFINGFVFNLSLAKGSRKKSSFFSGPATKAFNPYGFPNCVKIIFKYSNFKEDLIKRFLRYAQ